MTKNNIDNKDKEGYNIEDSTFSKQHSTNREDSITMKNYKTELLTGIRPTGGLTVANYLGAVAPMIELQDQGFKPLVFVADLHAITDNEPSMVRGNVKGVVADYIALGVDPKKANIYLQSDVAGEVTTFAAFLARHISVSELLRVPTLKDKLKDKDRPEVANALLLLYPVLMAADILLNKAKLVPVGEDQLSHMEVSRLLARRFNKKYGDVLPVPQVLQVKSLRILSLKGKGKMSKTNPGGAIFLTDSTEEVAKKIKVAETSIEGVMNDKLESLVQIAKGLAKTDSQKEEVDALIKAHMDKEPIMGKFKNLLTQIVQDFLTEFQARRVEVTKDPAYVDSILKKGAQVAKKNATETLTDVVSALDFK